ncbi:MAG: AAA family ATPase [Pirellulales bacterium]|nr:AAA family ATPase [Pirellulales bacterium]
MPKTANNHRPRKKVSPEILDALPPQAPEAELGLIGYAVAGNPLPDEARRIAPGCFTNPIRARLWGHILELVGRSAEVSPSTLTALYTKEDYPGELIFDSITSQRLHSLPESSRLFSKQIAEAANRRRGIEVAELLLQQAHRGPIDLSEARMLLDEAAPEPEEKKSFTLHPCSDLVGAEFAVRFLVEGVVVAGAPLVIAGPQKSLKTSIALDLAFSMATAGHFLGRFKAPEPIPVGFFSAESGLPTLAETLRRIAYAAGKNPADVHSLIISERVPQFSNSDDLLEIESIINQHSLQALFIDPVFMAMDGADAGNLFVQGQQIRRVSEVCQKNDCTLILLHHVKKGAGNDHQPLDLSSISWSGFAEAARQWCILSRREPYEPGTGLHKLHLGIGGSHGHGGYYGIDIFEGSYREGVDREWQVTVLSAEETKDSRREQQDAQREATQHETLEADRQEVVGVLTRIKSAETKSVIREQFSGGFRRFDRAFASLTSDGTLTPADVVRSNGQQYHGWRLSNDE